MVILPTDAASIYEPLRSLRDQGRKLALLAPATPPGGISGFLFDVDDTLLDNDGVNADFDAPGFFPLPEPLIQGPATRVMSLRDGAAKMSKSDPSDNSRINLTDDSDAIAAKIR